MPRNLPDQIIGFGDTEGVIERLRPTTAEIVLAAAWLESAITNTPQALLAWNALPNNLKTQARRLMQRAIRRGWGLLNPRVYIDYTCQGSCNPLAAATIEATDEYLVTAVPEASAGFVIQGIGLGAKWAITLEKVARQHWRIVGCPGGARKSYWYKIRVKLRVEITLVGVTIVNEAQLRTQQIACTKCCLGVRPPKRIAKKKAKKKKVVKKKAKKKKVAKAKVKKKKVAKAKVKKIVTGRG